MTPKEKAEDLINKMFHCDDYTPEESMAMLLIHAKQCALIAVEEMLKESVLPIISHRTDSYKTAEDFNKNFTHIKDQIDSFIISKYSYWQKVKHEIEKL